MRKFKGIITSVHYAQGGDANTYTMLSRKAIVFSVPMELSLMDQVEITIGDPEGPLQLQQNGIRILGRASESDYKNALDKLLKSVKFDLAQPMRIFPKGIDKKILKVLEDSAVALSRSFVTGAPMVVRFHNDGDGAICGIAMHRAAQQLIKRAFLNQRLVSWKMQKSIAYDEGCFSEDYSSFSSYNSVEKPVVMILDFGTCAESEKGIQEAGSNYEVIWIDHHVKYEGFESYKYVRCMNPWFYGLDSNVTAGMGTCAFAAMIKGTKVKDLVNASLISDHSTYAKRKDLRAAKIADVLDFITGSKNGIPMQGTAGITPRYLDSLIREDRLLEEAYDYANSKMSEALSLGVSLSKRYSGDDIDVLVLDFKKISDKGHDDILPGRYSSRLHDLLALERHGRTVITIVFYGNGMSIRSGKERNDPNLIELISRMRASCDYITSGGGHREAASIRTEKGRTEDVIRLAVVELGARLD